MIKPKGLVIFDMDGVVIDSINEYFITLRSTLEEFGVPMAMLPTFRTFLESFSNPPQPFYSQFGVAWLEAEKVFRTLAEIHFRTEVLYSGVVEAIKSLRSVGYKTAIVSSGYSDVVKRRLQCFNLTKLFDIVVTDKFNKAQVLRSCAQILLCPSHLTYFVGGLWSDMRDARLAEIRGVGFSAGHGFMRPVLINAGAEMCVDTHEQLVERLAA